MGKKIRLLSVGHSYVVAMNRAILRELAKDDDFEVTIGAPEYFHGSLRSLAIEPEPENSPLKIVPIKTYLTGKMHVFAYSIPQLNKLMAQGFDCAHFWEEPYIFSGFQLGQMAKYHEIPFLFRTAQSLIKKYIFPFHFFEKKTLQASQTWVAGGHLVHQAMLDKGWQKPGHILSLAVDTKAFQPMDVSEKNKKRQDLGLKGPVIGYLGRLSEEKGCDLFMEALGQLKDKDWSFLVMGDGPYKDKIIQWAKSEGLSDRVIVRLLKHDQVPDFLPLCDLLICPSQTRSFWKEQFGRMIVEAFAAGVVVVGSDSGEIPRVIADCGVVLPEDQTSLWKKEIANFLENPQQYEAFVEKGLMRAQAFSARNIAEKYKEIYRDLSQRGSE